MEKYITNLLTSTPSPVSRGRNINEDFSGPIIINDNAPTGKMYVQIAGFSRPVAAGGFAAKLYSSFNGYSWFLHSTNSPYIPIITTASSTMYNFPYLGTYNRMSFICNSTVSAVRCMIELNTLPKNL